MTKKQNTTYIHKMNNETLEVLDTELDGYIKYGSYWVTITYKTGIQVFIPNQHIACISRNYK